MQALGGIVSSFEFIFTLFGLLLGLSIAEVLGGLVRIAKLRQNLRIGTLTPLLGAFVLLDLLSFWMGAWDYREAIPLLFTTLVFGLAITGLYYLAASLVFPDRPEEWGDLDDYYLAHRRKVLGAVFLCNNSTFPILLVATNTTPSVTIAILILLYNVFLIVAFFSRRKQVSAVMLVALIMTYVAQIGMELSTNLF